MAKITLRGKEINTSGILPQIGELAKDFEMSATDLSIKTLANYGGKKLVLNIFPSVDTGTCARSVRNFNQRAAMLADVVVICISRDLPFAHRRFCGAEGIENVAMLSDFNTGQFGRDYGLTMLDGTMAGLHSRCIVIIDIDGKVLYTEQVLELIDEPNYDLALKHV